MTVHDASLIIWIIIVLFIHITIQDTDFYIHFMTFVATKLIYLIALMTSLYMLYKKVPFVLEVIIIIVECDLGHGPGLH